LWCTPKNTVADPTATPAVLDFYSPYQCSKIKCVMERPLNTGDTAYDWAFADAYDAALSPVINPLTDTTDIIDQMWIMKGRA